MDDPIGLVGDLFFSGVRTRPDPITLSDGIVSLAENIRFLRGRAEVRKGIKRLADDISPSSEPLIIPFSLASDFSVSLLTRAGATASATTTVAHGYTTGNTINISGANQTEYNGDFVITVTGATTFDYTVVGTPATPATGTILSNAGPIIRDSYSGGIFAACVFSSPKSTSTGNGDEWIILFASDQAYLFRNGETTLNKSYPSGEIIEESDSLQAIQCFDSAFLFREAPLTGLFARKSVTITLAATTATATSVAHGYSAGDRVSIEGANESAYNIEASVTPTGANTFTFTVLHAPASPATGTITCRKVKPPLVWDGGSGNFILAGGESHAAGATFSTLRSASVAAYTNNQLLVASTPTKDIILISDVLDANTFDPLLKAFRVNAGSNDYIVAIHPYAEGDVIVFGRKSIYRAHVVVASDGSSIDPASSFIELITSEVGCSAKNTIVTAGSFIYFLSDTGVFRLDTNYTDLKLRGVTLPLSDGIADQFSNINSTYVHLSSGIWFDSRYWITIPTGTDTTPNTMLIWSALNNEWESIDRFPTGIHSLLVSDYQSRRRLFGVSRSGKLYLMEEREDGDDPSSSSIPTLVNIPGRIITRRFTGGDMQTKRWLRAICAITLPAGSALEHKINVYDFDGSTILGNVSNSSSAEEGYVSKFSSRVRASSAELELTSTSSGRPVIRSAQLEFAASRPSGETRTAN